MLIQSKFVPLAPVIAATIVGMAEVEARPAPVVCFLRCPATPGRNGAALGSTR